MKNNNKNKLSLGEKTPENFLKLIETSSSHWKCQKSMMNLWCTRSQLNFLSSIHSYFVMILNRSSSDNNQPTHSNDLLDIFFYLYFFVFFVMWMAINISNRLPYFFLSLLLRSLTHVSNVWISQLKYWINCIEHGSCC